MSIKIWDVNTHRVIRTRPMVVDEVMDMRKWVEEHCPSARWWADCIGHEQYSHYEYIFGKEEEAMRFKLTWG